MNQYETQLKSAKELHLESELTLVDILRLLKDGWKTIVVSGLIGFTLSVAYILNAPQKYEAIAQFTMAQISDQRDGNIIGLLGINIEEPGLLIARMASPAGIPPKVMAACGVEGKKNNRFLFGNSVQLTVSKSSSSVVELKAYGRTPQLANECALGVFDYIKTTQQQLLEPYIEEAKVRIVNDEGQLQKAKEFMAKNDNSGYAITADYLSTRDEVSHLLKEIAVLKSLVSLKQNRPTRLIAPIYVEYVPVAPKKQLILSAGLFGGVLLGLVMALARRVATSFKSYAGAV